MRSGGEAKRRGRQAVLAVLAAAAVLGMSVPAAAMPLPTSGPAASTTPSTDHCPYRIHTPPAVDTSEVVAPGATTPTPLPVPDKPLGGERLGACGIITDPAAGPVPPRLTSAGWLIADLDSGRIIAAKDPHGRYRPASTIKLLLAMVALDELDLNTVVTPTPEDWGMEGDSCGMGPGGHYTNRDMLTGLLVVSGNDCANVLTRELGGHNATLAKMNAKARSLGALDTRAASPSGLDAPGMSTSPYDLAVIFREAMRNSTFRDMISKREYRFPGYPKRPDVPGDTDHPAYQMATSNHLLLEEDPGVLGGKTGYTDDARKTFVGAVRRDGRSILIVQMFGLTVENDSYWDQARSMIDYGLRAPADVRIGTLDGGSARSADPSAASGSTPTENSVAPTDSPADAVARGSGADRGWSWSVRLVIGLVCAIVVLILISIALSLTSRRRR